ncbi:hypothetical protein BDM02DRAFT_3125677 [Thelephora ganbajun]|uniref:Uncharacterized protein n=1 Tax=Thelephora ganbajun TaxID=370292 RepID=A0ACB6ZW36_THEGA|nr:hypothetical protein BDM02DRAFT_3125677 [Thelephora ganbajun]
MLKRPRDIFDSPSSSSPPSAKRFQSRPSSYASSSTFSSPLKGFATPSGHSVPSDSPSNPFSLKVAHILIPPIALRISKHLELRFQLVHTEPATSKRVSKSASYRSLRKHTYRVVLVPPNYSFKLLYKLILFLFDLDASPEHVFEIQEDVEVYSSSANRAGYVKKGQTKVKLSRNFDDQLKAEKGKGKTKVPVSKDGVEWEGEDDYHLGRVWPQGTEESKKAVLYHHDKMDSVHITLSKSDFERKKSKTNRPFVITAQDPDGPVEDYSVWNRGRNFERFLNQVTNEEEEEEDSDDGFDIIPRSDTPTDPLPLVTPYPSEPLLQKRLESTKRRLSRELPVKKSGDESSGSEPSSEEDETRARKPKSVQDEEDEKEKDYFVDDWDPFGDEAEL